jgi:hypothetical protein
LEWLTLRGTKRYETSNIKALIQSATDQKVRGSNPFVRTHVRHMNRRSKPLRHRKRRGFCVPVPGLVSLLVSVADAEEPLQPVRI